MRKTMKRTVSALCAVSVAASVAAMAAINAGAEATDENLTAINSATSDTIATAVSDYTTAAEKSDLYSVLPSCDKTEINTRILEQTPFASVAELDSAYDAAVAKTVGTDTDKYTNVFFEGFADNSFDTNEWTVTRTPALKSGGDTFSGTTAYALPYGDDNYCMYTAGSPIASAAYNGYISRSLSDISGRVCVYFYDSNTESDKSSVNKFYFVRLHDGDEVSATDSSNYLNLGVWGNSKYYTQRYKTNGTDNGLKALSIARTAGWHKLEFDATSGEDIKGYIDGQLVITYKGMTTLKNLVIGNITQNNTDYSYFSTDCITVEQAKTEEECIEEFNSSPSVRTLKNALEQTAADLCGALPLCDQKAVLESLDGTYSSAADLTEAFWTAAAELIQPTGENIFTEDFADGIDSSWEISENAPAAITSGESWLGNTVQTLGASETETKAIGFWGSSVEYDATGSGTKAKGSEVYIKRAVKPNSKTTLYFYDYQSDKNTPSLGIKINDKVTIGANSANKEYYVYNTGDEKWSTTGTAISKGWHKVVIDGTRESGRVYISIDGGAETEIDTSVEYLQIGNIWSYNGYSLYSVDSITISESDAELPTPNPTEAPTEAPTAEPTAKPTAAPTAEPTEKPAPTPYPEEAKTALDAFNTDATADNFAAVMKYIDDTLYTALPSCDRDGILSGMTKNVPYDSVDGFEKAYRSELYRVTVADGEKYDTVFYEGFGDGLNTDTWEISKKPAITAEGEKKLSMDMVSVNASGDEKNSLLFWGKSISNANADGEKVNGDNMTLKTAVAASDSIVTLYFYDFKNDNTPALGVKINDSVTVGAYSGHTKYCYSIDGGKTWKDTSIERSKGWHKIVFDGLTDDKYGLVTIYLDGEEVAQTDTAIEYLGFGNYWSYNGYTLFAVDNISVVQAKAEPEKVTVTDTKGNPVTSIGSNTALRIMVENSEAKTDYIAASYDENGVLKSIGFITKEQQANGQTGIQLKLNGGSTVRIMGWESLQTMVSTAGIIELKK